MSTKALLFTMFYTAILIFGICGLVFYKSFKKHVLNLLFNKLNPFGLPQQSNFQVNLVLIGLLIFFIIFGLIGDSSTLSGNFDKLNP